jgi:hypothetical protein
MTHDEMIEVIQAHKDGKVIQRRLRVALNAEFTDRTLTNPYMDFAAFEYRVKPEPIEYWLVPYTYKAGLEVFYFHPVSVGAGTGFDLSNVIHVVTVVKDGEIT